MFEKLTSNYDALFKYAYKDLLGPINCDFLKIEGNLQSYALGGIMEDIINR